MSPEYEALLVPSAKTKHWFPPVRADLERLLSVVDEVQPESILEYGTGWSTLLLSHLAEERGLTLESLENDPVYYAIARAAVPNPNARRRVLFSPVANVEGMPGAVRWTYRTLLRPEFIYVDGPALFSGFIIAPELCLNHIKAIYFDGREANARWLAEELKETMQFVDLSEGQDQRFLLQRMEYDQ